MAYLFAVLPVVLIGTLILSGPLIMQVNDAIDDVVVPTPIALQAGGANDPESTPYPLPDWDKKERINILLIGVDRREDDEFMRTDTMILVSIDPIRQTVGIMSLPRDLKVSIPGYHDDKLNASFVFGEMDKRPGGGVGLLMRTIASPRNFGVPVHYFAQVDFQGFEKVVNTFGGVNVDPPYPIKDDAYPTETFGYTGLYFPAGLQHLDGQAALRYARTRHDDGDFGRAHRQQEVLLALRQQALTRDLPSKFGQLLTILSGSVRTDLRPEQAAALAKLGQSIPRENIKSYNLLGTFDEGTEVDAAGNEIFYLYPNWTQVRKQMREMIPDLPQVVASPTPDAKVKIVVRNGTLRPNFAARTAEHLKASGFTGAVVDASFEAGDAPLSTTVIYDYTGRGEMGVVAARLLGIPENAVVQGVDPAPSGVDILIVLADDMPYNFPPPGRR